MVRDILILANEKGGAWNLASNVYQGLKNRDGTRTYSLGRVEITKFPDGEIYAEILDSVRKKTVYFIHDSSMNAQDWFASLLFTNDALKRSSAEKICNVLPYMRYSRQDRMADPRSPISASVLASALDRQVYRILTTDLHNPATQGSYHVPFDNLKAYPVLINHLNENYPDFLKNAVVVAPDAGSAKRAETYARRLSLDVAIIHKKRKKAEVSESGKRINDIDNMTVIGDVKGKNALIPDDLIDTGGTLCMASDKLLKSGAIRVFADATHGVLSTNPESRITAREKIEMSSLEKVVITNSISQESKGKIEVISLKGLYEEAIYRIAHGHSISELFE